MKASVALVGRMFSRSRQRTFSPMSGGLPNPMICGQFVPFLTRAAGQQSARADDQRYRSGSTFWCAVGERQRAGGKAPGIIFGGQGDPEDLPPGATQSSRRSAVPQSNPPRLDPENVERMVSEAARQAGVKFKVTPHTLRHNFATRFLAKNQGDIATLATILGHANISTTARYPHQCTTSTGNG